LIACVEELLTLAAHAPATAAPAFAPAPAPASAEAVEFAPPDFASDLPDDIWGSDFAPEGAIDAADFPAADAFAATSQDDLWDVSGFETETPVDGAAADDLWGSFEVTPSVDTAVASAVDDVGVDSWGSDDFSSAFAAADSNVSDAFASAAEVPLDDVEILEEIDLLEPIADSSSDMLLADSFAPDDFSFAEALLQPEAVAAPSIQVEPAPVSPAVMPLPLPVVEVAPPVGVVPSEAGAATSVGTLSDAQLDLIVERVAGVVVSRLTGTLLEKIAWEVVPDLAETMIKEELRKIREAVAAN
jgi:hypothetical protein